MEGKYWRKRESAKRTLNSLLKRTTVYPGKVKNNLGFSGDSADHLDHNFGTIQDSIRLSSSMVVKKDGKGFSPQSVVNLWDSLAQNVGMTLA